MSELALFESYLKLKYNGCMVERGKRRKRVAQKPKRPLKLRGSEVA